MTFQFECNESKEFPYCVTICFCVYNCIEREGEGEREGVGEMENDVYPCEYVCVIRERYVTDYLGERKQN